MMRKALLVLAGLTALVAGAQAQDQGQPQTQTVPTWKLSVYAKNQANLYDQNGNTMDKVVVVPSLDYDNNGSGMSLATSFFGDGGVAVAGTGYPSTIYASSVYLQKVDTHLNLLDGHLYVAAGKLDIPDFVPSLEVDGLSPLVGARVGGNPNYDLTPANMVYWSDLGSSYGAFARVNLPAGISLGAYAPLVDEAGQTPTPTVEKSQYKNTEYVGKMDFPGWGTLYGGYLGFTGDLYGAVAYTGTRDLVLKVGYDYNNVGYGYTNISTYATTMVSASYDLHLVKFSVDAGVGRSNYGSTWDYAIATQTEVPFNPLMSARFHWTYLSEAADLVNGFPKINGAAAANATTGWDQTDDYLYPEFVLKATPGLPALVRLGFQYDYRNGYWCVPLVVEYVAL